MNRPTLVVRNVLLSEGDEVLLGLRRDTLRWELPGGKVDDETVAQAAMREQLEETSMELLGVPSFLGYADTVSVKKPDRRFVELFLSWPRWTGYPRVTEPKSHVQWKWTKFEEIPRESLVMPGSAHFLFKLLPTYLSVQQGREEWDGCDIDAMAL